jgi:hypothetical protein
MDAIVAIIERFVLVFILIRLGEDNDVRFVINGKYPKFHTEKGRVARD